MNSHNVTKPPSGADVRRVGKPPKPNDHLLEQVLSKLNMQTAWKRVEANKGAPGVDNMAIEQFPAFARESWPKTRHALQAGNYQPKPVKRVEIPKPTGGLRPLGIPIKSRSGHAQLSIFTVIDK
jgi:RNA-directed DNA polymerase